MQSVPPRAYLADAAGAIGLVVGVEATLLTLVLGFLISTRQGLLSSQLHQWQTIGLSILALYRGPGISQESTQN